MTRNQHRRAVRATRERNRENAFLDSVRERIELKWQRQQSRRDHGNMGKGT
jgi:hypothetical protein